MIKIAIQNQPDGVDCPAQADKGAHCMQEADSSLVESDDGLKLAVVRAVTNSVATGTGHKRRSAAEPRTVGPEALRADAADRARQQ